MAKPKKEKLPTNFEDALSKLDTIVETLEGEAIPLHTLVDNYELGMKLLQGCRTQLTDAKQRVTKINESYRLVVQANQDDTDDDDEPELSAEAANDELF